MINFGNQKVYCTRWFDTCLVTLDNNIYLDHLSESHFILFGVIFILFVAQGSENY